MKLTLIRCLEVIPETDDNSAEYIYKIEQDALVLTVAVWQYESVVSVSLRQQETNAPLIEFALFVREGVQYIEDKRGEYLEFRDCIVAPSRFSYLEMGNMLDKTKFNHGLKIQLAIKSNIQVRHIRN